MNYSDILNKIAFKEIISLLLVIIILFSLITVVWIVSFKSFKKNHRFQHNELKKQNKKKCIIGLIFLTVFSISIVLFCLFDNIKYLHKIYKDINEESYVTYSGSYYMASSAIDANPPAPTTIDIYLENNETLYLYVDLLQWAFTIDGEYTGQIIYGKNSLIIVDMKNS